MPAPHLSVVPETANKPKPKFLHQIADDARLSEIFVYSQRDFYMGAQIEERSRNFDPNNPPMPFYSQNNLIELGGDFTKSQLQAALESMTDNEDLAITQLRELIVLAIEDKKLYEVAVRTPEDAHKHGIVFLDKYLSDEGVPLGIMAYDM